MQPTPVLVTITGRDRPGVTASLFSALAAFDVEIRDVEQVVIRGRLVLATLLDVRGDAGAMRASLTHAAAALGVECEIVDDGPSGDDSPLPPMTRNHVMVIGHPLRPGALSHVAQCIAGVGGNIDSVTQLSTEPAASLELIVRAPDALTLRTALVRAADETGVDIAIEPAGLRRRAKRLVVLDVDSTLIRDEAIDVLAVRAGVADEVADLTRRAMADELDFAQSLRARVGLLAGLTTDDLAAVRDSLQLTPGARTFVRTLRRMGYHVGVVSGGFTFVTERFRRELELDFAAANELEVVDGVVTGRLVGEIVDRAGKATALVRFAEQFGVPLSQTVAVGDGANDIDMLDAPASAWRSTQRRRYARPRTPR